jgi:hypothetical protein
MNAINHHLEETARKGFERFKSEMPELCRMMEFNYGLDSFESDGVDFLLDGIHFTLTWEESERKAIGRNIPVVMFQLSVWHTTWGSRWEPPESIDTLIVSSQSVYDVMREAILCVVKNKMDGCLESIGDRVLWPQLKKKKVKLGKKELTMAKKTV